MWCPGASSKQELWPPKGAGGESGYTLMDINRNKHCDAVGPHGLRRLRLPVFGEDGGKGKGLTRTVQSFGVTS